MKEKSIIEVGESRPGWEALEAYAREGIRRLLATAARGGDGGGLGPAAL